jgi:hypothetical protein
MRNRAAGLIAALMLLLAMAFSSVAFAQEGPPAGAAGGASASAPGPPHDPHDLYGVWQGPVGGGGGGGGGAQVKTASAWAPKMALPLTPEGQKQIDANHPGGGPRGNKPAFGNDPLGGANPPGLTRSFLYGNFGVGFMLVQLPDEVLQLFDYAGFWRQIWTDGRKLPRDPDPNWYGTSVGKFDGDVFAVQTAGLEPRAWLDAWGTPCSDQLRLEERWHRLDRDNLELVVTFTDPVMYMKPWTGDKKMYRLQPKGSKDGEIYQMIFAPMDEQSFDNNVRDPVAGVNHTPSK